MNARQAAEPRDRLWQAHLENVALRQQIRELERLLYRERRLTEQWRVRAMNGRPAGRATRKVSA